MAFWALSFLVWASAASLCCSFASICGKSVTVLRCFGVRSKIESKDGSHPKQGFGRLRKPLAKSLRVISGTVRGRSLVLPQIHLRPMMARVREALFNSLVSLGVFESRQLRVLDLFSGAGSVGMEALSRGADHVTMVDYSPVCSESAKQTIEKLGFQKSKANVVTASVSDFLKAPNLYGCTKPFNIVTVTPPYKEVSYPELISQLSSSTVLERDSLVVIEYPKELKSLPFMTGNKTLFGLRNRKYGRTVLATYVYRPTDMSCDMRPDEFLTLQ